MFSFDTMGKKLKITNSPKIRNVIILLSSKKVSLKNLIPEFKISDSFVCLLKHVLLVCYSEKIRFFLPFLFCFDFEEKPNSKENPACKYKLCINTQHYDFDW